MKLKNLNTTLLILAGLLCLSLAFFAMAEQNSSGAKNIFLDSDQDGLADTEEKAYGTNPKNSDTDGDGYSDGAEVKAGYNPLKKAPGDKLSETPKQEVKGESITAKISGENDKKTTTDTTAKEASVSGEKENLTEKVAGKISALANQKDPANQTIDMEDIQGILDSIMSGEDFKDELPKVSKDDIKILKQNYGNLSEKKAKEKKKEDAINYSVAVLYIFTSNSPEPLTSSTDAISILQKTIKQISSSFNSGNPESLNDLSNSGEKIYEQLKEVVVPEDMTDTQIKALQYALYAQDLKNIVKLDQADPLASLSNYSKIANYVKSLNAFYDEIKSKLDDYGIEYNEVQSKLEDHGIKADIFGTQE
ncbi:MAG TPA: hypothetical protein P5232_02335 [Candidatus Moranbacteria bacterium]|nr:hypothetical protein [Candidatus Moranbacteria bacterium]